MYFVIGYTSVNALSVESDMTHFSLTLLRLVVLTAGVTMAGWSQAAPNASLPTGKHVFPIQSSTSSLQGAVKDTAKTYNGITYHGGPIMLGTIDVYYIWYGNWSGSTGLNAMTVLQNLASNIGGSPYFNINSTYYNGSGTALSNSVHFGGFIVDNYSQGANIDDAGVSNIVALAISSGQLPRDTNGVYFVLTSSDVSETTGFCTAYCGWHYFGTISGADIKYAFVGNANACLLACAAQNTSPNGDPGVDAMASIIAHELTEATNDPELTAWYFANGDESADKCAWNFGSYYAVGNGSFANINLGGLNYLIQQLWVNASATNGYCALSYGPPGPTLTSVSPASGLQGTVVPVTLTGTGFSANSTINVTGTGVNVANTVVVNSTEITANFVIAGNAAPGGYSVTVSASSGVTLSRTFTVTSLTPTLTSVSPSSGAPGASVPVTLTGTNFVSPVTVNIPGSGVTAGSASVVSSTQITTTFNISSGATLGGYTVSVTTINGTSGTATFTVAPPPPTLTSISPSSASPSTNTPVTLTGTNFTSPVTINIGASGVTTSGVTVTSNTQINANFNVAANATTGDHNVSVSTSNGTTGAVTFTVNGSSGGGSGPPSLSNISPAAGAAGTTVKVTLTGKHLTGSPGINVTGSGITVTSVTPVGNSGTTLTANFIIATNATKAARVVTVHTTEGTSNTVSFTVQ
jgi:hypothetical protein